MPYLFHRFNGGERLKLALGIALGPKFRHYSGFSDVFSDDL